MMVKNIFSYYLLKFTAALHRRLSDMFPQDYICILSILTVSKNAVLKAFFSFSFCFQLIQFLFSVMY